MQFSIIIPTRNELKNLKQVLPQFKSLSGHFQYEVIVSDADSTDGTIEYARSVADKVQVTKERGIGLGRNRGAEAASGDIIVFLDAGVIIPDVLHFFRVIYKRFSDSSIIAAATNVSIEPDKANFSDRVVHGAVNGIVRFINFLGMGAGKGECQIIRRSAFEQVHGYNEKLIAAEDNDLFRRLARVGKVVFLKELRVYDDPRRYRKLGYPRVIGQWLLNQFSVIFRGKSYSKEWKRID